MKQTITQGEIAEMLGITASGVSNALRGVKPIGQDGRKNLYDQREAVAAMRKEWENARKRKEEDYQEGLNVLRLLKARIDHWEDNIEA